MRKWLFLSAISFLILSCNNKAAAPPPFSTLFQQMRAPSTNIHFTNKVTNTDQFNIFKYRNFYNGGGVAIGDINNDGWADVYMTANMGDNKLFLNKGNWEFEDISASAGIIQSTKWSTGVVMVDINADGFLDIYVCNAGLPEGDDQKNALFINQGNNTFLEEAEEYNLADNGYTTHAAFFDYDRDGDLDVYILNNSFIPANTLNYTNKRDLRAQDWKVKPFLKGGGDKLMRNDNGQFTDVSERAGIYGSLIGFGLGVTVGDVNGDAWQDIYISNDFFEKDYLYINDGNGHFTEQLEKRISHLSHSSMGADMADINNDGHLEIFVTDMLPGEEYRLKTTSNFDNTNLRNLKEKQGFYHQYTQNTLQLNDGDGHFSEISHYGKVAATDWSWGALMFDADNDSYTDLLVCNGIYNDVMDQDFIDFFANDVLKKMALSGKKEEIEALIAKMPSVPISNKAYKNTGELQFEDVSKDWGLDTKTFSNGAAYGDLDNDGDLDLVINNVNQAALVYQNQSSNNYISFQLNFQKPNLFAVGAKIKVHQKENVLTRELLPSRGFQSSVDYKINIGLGENTAIDSIEITWPNGQKSSCLDCAPNQLNLINYEAATSYQQKPLVAESPLFIQARHPFEKHKEDAFNDFNFERNIPVQLSKEGPCSAIGDINQDGKDDLFIGGATGQAPKLYISTSKGFQSIQESFFSSFKDFEDTYALFFDSDGDGDLDLIVGSGGNNIEQPRQLLLDRLYINNKGVFEYKEQALPTNQQNTSVIQAHDFNGDGQLDLFVGSRSKIGAYGLNPGSFIYTNNGDGTFRDNSQNLIPEIATAGMVTDVIWADILPDNAEELILVGEWMAPIVLAYNGQQFEVVSSNLSDYAGWWQSIAATDIDQDGDIDFVLGNMGENFYLQADADHPLGLWINDFDNNSSPDKIITRHIDGKEMPVVMKKDLTEQLPELRKQNILHKEYASKSIGDLFGMKILKKSIVKKINYLQSAIAINDGNGTFTMKALPTEVQLSCVNDIAITDLNQDGLEDIILAGNNHYFAPQFGRLDACQGKVLLNDGEGGFQVLPKSKSGLKFKGVTRELALVTIKNQQHVLALLNNQTPVLYQVVP